MGSWVETFENLFYFWKHVKKWNACSPHASHWQLIKEVTPPRFSSVNQGIVGFTCLEAPAQWMCRQFVRSGSLLSAAAGNANGKLRRDLMNTGSSSGLRTFVLLLLRVLEPHISTWASDLGGLSLQFQTGHDLKTTWERHELGVVAWPFALYITQEEEFSDMCYKEIQEHEKD